LGVGRKIFAARPFLLLEARFRRADTTIVHPLTHIRSAGDVDLESDVAPPAAGRRTSRTPPRTRSAWTRRRESRGQSAVELALVLPILALVLFACLKLGLAFFSYEQVASAANAGARAAAVNHGSDPTVAARAAANSMSPTLGLSDSQITVSYTSTATPPGAAWSYPGTVTVTVDYPLTFSLLGLLPQTFDLQASATKRLER
jgi:Flp pilus assembly protein TadG